MELERSKNSPAIKNSNLTYPCLQGFCTPILPQFHGTQACNPRFSKTLYIETHFPIKTGDQIPNLYIDIHTDMKHISPSPKKIPISQTLCMVLSCILDCESWQSCVINLSAQTKGEWDSPACLPSFMTYSAIYKKRISTKECTGMVTMSRLVHVMVRKHGWKGQDDLGDCWKVS